MHNSGNNTNIKNGPHINKNRMKLS